MLPQRQQYPRPALPLRSLLCLVRKTLRSRFAPSHPAAWSALKPAVPDPPAVWEFSARVRGITGQNDACNFFLLFLEQEILRISGSGIPLAFLMAIPLFPPGLVMLLTVLLGTVCSGRISGRIFRILALALGIALCPAWSAALEAENASGEEMALPGPDAPLKGGDWRELAPGLRVREYVRGEAERVEFVALRMDPQRCEIVLCSAAFDGKAPRTPEQWAGEYGLNAVINAGMYLPDGLTSTAYMRSGEKTNNGRIAEKYGSFFVSSPRQPSLPDAALLDKDADDWKALLPQYDVAVQNFRLLGPGGVQRWPENGPRHSIAAVGMNGQGEIFFLHCETPVSVHEFVRILREESGLGLTRAMYVEGGAQAVLGVWTPTEKIYRKGRHPANFLLGGPVLPNVLGVRLLQKD